ncbi:MobF family relaxase [Paraburkholderia dioscoreae]|uniref:Conjugal transfer protein n=1 Tax=Paraburkholderia dioscoreae TaxID=2604047 RepID=A0A5Q4ZI03_9BURK|nr:MobF family relaxase [Paraburkholderia dioscoreae]VVD30966.1 Conjugal transfer protein [Paraburkholderia dioscoreae]
MISMTHISGSGVGNAARYHDKSFTQDAGQKADNYYVNEKASAHWEGRGAELLGIKGKEVEREHFVNFLNGKLVNPVTGELQDLADNSKGEDRRAGMDFTIAPSKSVSIAGLVGKDDRVVAAHLQANARAMAWLEKHAAVIRVKDENGRNKPVLAKNLLYATVMHETNRENEPQIHSHNVIVSAVFDEKNQKWRSLTNDQMLNLRSKADVIYKAELAKGLKQAGYELEYATNGVDFEIKGFTAEHIETYATRKAQIKEALIKRGIEPGDASFDARQTAALDSRSAKHELPRDALQAIWQETGRDAGFNIESIVNAARERSGQSTVERSIDGARVPENSQQQTGEQTAERSGATSARDVEEVDRKAALRAVSWAVEHMSEREQAFSLADLEVTAVKFSRGGIDDVDWAVAQHVKNHLIVERGTAPDGSLLYTTHKAIDSEMRLVENIRAGMGKNHVVLTDRAEFEAAIKAFEAKKELETGAPFKLSREQVTAARNVLMHLDSIQGIQGEAGTGKTAALAMVNDVANAKGWNVIGVATSAAAAKELEAASGIKSDTVAGYFAARDTRIKATELRLEELRAAMSADTKIRETDTSRLETRRLTVDGADIEYGEHRYTFDHQRGEVFKSPDDFRNAVGAMLTDLANRHRDVAVDPSERANTFAGRVVAGAMNVAVDAAESLGRRWMTFEQVGTVEAVAARNTLYLEKEGGGGELRREYETKQAELANLKRFGNAEGRKTLIVMDESSLTGAFDTEKISNLAREIGARVVFQGDIKQHGSVAAGKAFEQAQNSGMHVSVLEETRRFDKATAQTKQALHDMKAGRYSQAVGRLDTLEVENDELAKAVAIRYLSNMEELKGRGLEQPKVGVVAITNNDRKAINSEIHSLLASNGLISATSFTKEHLDDPKLTKAEQTQAVMLREKLVDTLIFRKTYREIGVEKGDVLSVLGYDATANRIIAKNAVGQEITINPQRQDFFSPAKREDREYAVGDRVETRAIIRLPEQELQRISNGTAGVITEIDGQGAKVRWSRDGRESYLKNDDLRFIDHAYAHTSYKEQGATNDREIIAVSATGAKVFNRLAAYVAASRAKDNTEIVTSDLTTLRRNAGQEVEKTTAVDFTHDAKRDRSSGREQAREQSHTRQRDQAGNQQTKAEKVKDRGRTLEL